MKVKKYYKKPKEVSDLLSISPYYLIKYSKQIEAAKIQRFPRTPFGSFLFREMDVELLREYIEILNLFRQKELSLNILKNRISFPARPYWMSLLRMYK